jgi:hypothetical protein
MRQRFAVLVLWTALSMPQAHAFDMIGNGVFSCGEWVADHLHQDAVSIGDDAWLAGYLSAYNFYTEDKVLTLPDEGGRSGWMGNYCRNHPLEKIYLAADQLILELKRQARK